jgi:spore coat protein U-like protein
MNHMFNRWLLLLVMLGLGGLWTPSAHAQVSCSATMSAVNFSDVDPLGGDDLASATLEYECTNSSYSTMHARVCFSLGEPGGASVNPRRMDGPSGNKLDFQLYTDSARTRVWGSQFFGSNTPLEVPLTIPARGWLFGPDGRIAGSAPIYGRVFGPQPSVPSGSYQRNYGAGDTAITLATSTGPTPASCPTGGSTRFTPFVVQASVARRCTVSATTMDFGNVAGFLAGNRDATSVIGVQCVAGTAYKVGLDNGTHGTRRMAGPGGFISYELYRNSGRTQRWGNTPGTDTRDGSGSGGTQNLTVYGRVPPQSTPAAGTYADTVTVTVTY